jgi:hypothetical protein
MALRTTNSLTWIWRQFQRVGALVLIVLLLFGANLMWRLGIDRAETFADPVAQFKYGSTGGDKNFGFPYAMWQAMPVLFKDFLPEGRQDEGWAALGFLYEEEKDSPPELRRRRPVGTSLRNHMGVERVFLNCAGCHAGRVRTEEGGKSIIYAGMPANTLDLSAFQEFLRKAALSQHFTPERFLAQIDAMRLELGFINRLVLRYYGVAFARTQILLLADRFDFLHYEPAFGPGRFDTFNPAKALLNWNFKELPKAERIGVVDFPAVWLQKQKEGMQLHWDGNNTNVQERNRSAAFGTGATPAILDRASIKRMEEWLATAEPPKFADLFPGRFNAALAARGAGIFARECAQCHGKNGRDFSGADTQVGKVMPIDEIGTDRSRFDNYTYELSLNQNALYAGITEERFQSFRKTKGYARMPLDGIWLRAPYLHNGSVPTLRDLLRPPRERPQAFLRGHDVYDPVNVGFESRPDRIPQEMQKKLFCYVTHAAAKCPAGVPKQGASYVCDGEGGVCKGNGNHGHEFGLSLSDDEKGALIEHMKTF